MSDDNFASDFNKQREAETPPDSNNDGIVDGSPESIKKMGEDIGKALGGFFSGIMDGLKSVVQKDEPVKEESEENKPQVLNE